MERAVEWDILPQFVACCSGDPLADQMAPSRMPNGKLIRELQTNHTETCPKNISLNLRL